MGQDERRRLSWIQAYGEVRDAGAVCRRFGISQPVLRKRLRHELRRLHGVVLSPATIHKVLVRPELDAAAVRRRGRHKPKRCSRPIPGDRVQLDTCKIRPGLCQYTAIDDCSRFLVLGLARRRSAAATLAFLDQVAEEMPFPIQRIQTNRGADAAPSNGQRRLRPLEGAPPHPRARR